MAHVKGSITKIKLENFVTYDSVEVSPGPQLNVIIGPNGTGKSTIVCAICLGLAGKTALLGRAQNPAEFIKHRKEKALIEITLNMPEGNPRVIQREISRSKSDWKLNGKGCTQKAVEDFVTSLNIQVGNLCQFLPQDKVADFAKMSQQQLLESTQKAVGDPEMFKNHQWLKNAREEGRDLERQVANNRQLHQQEQQKNNALENDVKNFKERKKHQETIEILNQKRKWVVYQRTKMEHEELKTEREAKKQEYDRETERLQPLEAELKAIKDKIEKIEKEQTLKTKALQDQANRGAACLEKQEKFSEEIADVEDALQAKKQDEQRRLKKLADLEKVIVTLQNELVTLGENQNLAPMVEEMLKQGRAINHKITDMTRECNEVRSQRDAFQRRLTASMAEKQELENVHHRRMNILRRFNNDAFRARQWLDDNRDKFSSRIYGPIMVEINVADHRNAKYVESRVSAQDMYAFVCEDKRDQNKFLQYIRDQQKIPVAAVWMGPKASDTFHPKHPIHYYKNSGFRCYLKDMLDCPEPVMRYLCLQYNIHQVPVGDKTTERNLDQIIRTFSSELSLFYTENQLVSVRKSKYGNRETSTRCSDLGAARFLTVSMDTTKLAEVNNNIEGAEQEIQVREERMRELENLKREQEVTLNQLNKKKKELTEKRDMRVSLEHRIQSKKDSRVHLMSATFNLEAEKKKAADKIRVIINKKIANLDNFKQHTRNCIEHTTQWVRLGLRRSTMVKKQSKIREEKKAKEASYRQIQEELNRLTELTRRKKEEAVKALHEAKQVKGCENGVPPKLKQIFNGYPGVVEEIDAAINEARSRVECTSNTGVDVIEEYEERKVKIGQLEKLLEDKEDRLNNFQREIDETRNRWMEPLQELIGRINKSFSFFFKSMKCAGEVDLNVPENPEDYKDYGVRIKVKYRDNESLRELTAHHQSGGERSVATILYMMALQELTSCPFRCVDEINQGMDPTNERKVFELVTQTVCKNSTSQYFLLTPKLLPDLAYGDHMTVMCIYNGSEMMSHTDWSLRKYLRRRRKADY